MRTDGHHQHVAQFGGQDRPARRKGIGRRTGGRGHDQAIGHIGGKVSLVYVGGQADHARYPAPANDHFVQRIPGAGCGALATQAAAEHRPLLEPVLAVQDAVQAVFPLVAADFGQKAQPAHVDAQYGRSLGGDEVCGVKHGAVPAEGDQYVHVVCKELFRPLAL